MATTRQHICAVLAVAVLGSCGAEESAEEASELQAPATAYRPPSEPRQSTWPAAVGGDWRVIEWVPGRIGTWSLDEGNALVGQVARLHAEEVRVPGYTCERPSFQVSDTGMFWEQFKNCQNNEPARDCPDIHWAGEAMLDCNGSESGPAALVEVSATCSDGEGLPFTFSQLSVSRAFLHLPDGRGYLCLELTE